MADLGERACLDEGLLYAYVVEAVSRRALVALLARAAVRNVGEAEGLVEWAAERFSVESSRAGLHAAVDGEPVVLASPLRFEVRPRAPRVLVPASAD
jgi:diacylglycerol kinase family enzyme